MATYLELSDLFSNDTLKRKVKVAMMVAADLVRSEEDTVLAGFSDTNHTNRLKLAKRWFRPDGAYVDIIIHSVLAANRTVAASSIIAASDSAVQTNVNSVMDIFADGT